MRKFNLTLAIAAVAILFSGCKLDKMIKLAKENDLQVAPSPLEVHGGEVPFEMSAVLPPKILPSNTSFTLNTIYQYGDQEVSVGSVEFKAEDFPNSSNTTSRKNESFSFPYSEGMNPGTLYVEGVATDTKSGKSKTTDRLAVAQGLILTSQWVQNVVVASYADHGYDDREELMPTNIDFYFDRGKSNLRTSLKYGGESNQSRREALRAFIAEKNVTRTIAVTGSHSPEGSEAINTSLSENRAKTIEAYYRKQMDRYDYKGTADSIEFVSKPVIQNWSEFKTTLAEYDGIDDDAKSQYTNIMNGTGTYEEKEKEMQKLPTYKKVFNDIYPGLRYAKTETLTVTPKKSNAEIAVLAKSITNSEAEADALSDQELLFSATLTPSLEEKAAIYKAAIDKNGSWQAHNNLGAIHLEMDNLDEAVTQFEIAANKNPEAAVVKSNMGAVLAAQMDFEKAYATLSDASGGSGDVTAKINAMKGALEVRMGEYDKAKASFNSAMLNDAASIDKGLAHLLSGDLTQANGALAMVSGESKLSGISYYLMAVSSARDNDMENVKANLKEAVGADPSLKEKALNDMEFANFSNEVNEAVK